ncbi:hypothetical protein A2697_00670 [Candidatus Curtissbacteria bacterium RIFCSPHIGHO2_01_FULL_41_44]|uniref:Small ribosomal subunit protein bS20 n=1 Tax=Candidatus Curtissbacteria bacterium RIFCSPLOWO2_01_FULL_42_50 TaxID=1797730 RepID=A0A1F5H3Z8_9BACT|nr:MAG: hypothetical protein A2697_00670 [Candidatus Curtissbacteria bacterium RIFCSPHIGHO2_01_FULL_41_44]OGD93381.1 MAG: hypothetical protein A3C33_03295 [Candidatus Curtissbacteria bacterium RIFCSPHIGHO2_02_FULL_42_58]OGD97097.1 MAG: hypothetical protein A3E71_04535 [Candidatus Curtissbacteria bacterium RIFCSPHIGHO2_12_FULL_42_33]OGD98886.1 MAG: hypothetical protein A3B54_05000 [Candidatus Curtissbacteria bacterium RIFCSPLOWO2_01_FULL_42_50]OGE03011.1 MAG: hypothetical protein A3G16_04785 [Ca
MPVTKQAIKKVRQDKRKTVYNLKVKKALKATVLAFRKKPTQAGLLTVYKAADRAAKTNVIHKNKAARIKSRLSKMLTKVAGLKVPIKKSSKTKPTKS